MLSKDKLNAMRAAVRAEVKQIMADPLPQIRIKLVGRPRSEISPEMIRHLRDKARKFALPPELLDDVVQETLCAIVDGSIAPGEWSKFLRKIIRAERRHAYSDDRKFLSLDDDRPRGYRLRAVIGSTTPHF